MTRAILPILFGLVFVVLIGASVIIHFATMDTVTGVTVTGKERITTGSGQSMESKYLIFTDRETFENVDSVLGWKFNSSDVYGRIAAGQVCTFDVAGFRIPILSMYRNILTADCS
jgi:hypothetical protein